MIIYGMRATTVSTTLADGYSCENCGTENSTHITVASRYAHIFWLPLIPFGKTGFSNCEHCKLALSPNKMQPALKDFYREQKDQAKTPKWHFLGLGLIGILVIIGYFSDKNNQEKYREYIANPQTKDVYVLKEGRKEYTTMRVFDVVDDSVMFEVNAYSISSSTKIDKIDNDSSYYQIFETYHKNDLIDMLEDKIQSIKRND